MDPPRRLAAAWTAGRSKAISTPMMAITTRSSINVNARREAGAGSQEWVLFQRHMRLRPKANRDQARCACHSDPGCFRPKHHLGYSSIGPSSGLRVEQPLDAFPQAEAHSGTVSKNLLAYSGGPAPDFAGFLSSFPLNT